MAVIEILGDVLHWLWQNPVVAGITLGIELLGIWFAIRAIDTARTSQGAIAWVGGLVAFPIFAVPLFFLFGQRRFQKYVRLRGRHDAQSPLQAEIRERMRPYIIQPQDEFGRARVLRELSDLPFTSRNDLQLLIDGQATFDAILAAVAHAKQYVLMQFYIFRDDGLGRRVREALIERAKAGVKVCVLYDEIGSYGLKPEYFAPMLEAGVQVTGFKTTKGLVNPFQLNFRNHRKIVICDGETAFVGGHNVGDEYLGLDPKLSPWRDTHVRIVGPSVLALQLSFVEDWRWATSEVLELRWEPQPAQSGDRVVFVLPSSPADQYETCGLFFAHAMNCAARRIWIASPYLVPDEATLAAMQLAALRGVDVRLLLPGVGDHRSTWLAAHSYFEEVLTSGVKLFKTRAGFMHQKVVLVDDAVSVVGTANFDNRSFRLNFEISVLTIDEEFGGQVRQMLEEDFRNSHEVTLEDCRQFSTWLRIGARTARLLSPIL